MSKKNQDNGAAQVSEVKSEETSLDVSELETPDMVAETSGIPAETSSPAETSESKAPTRARTVADLIKPLCDKVKSIAVRFAETARRYLNPSNSGRQFYDLGELADEWQRAAHDDAKERGVTFSRKNVSGLIKDVGRAADVPDSLNRPHEFSATYWLARLVHSVPPESAGDLRAWNSETFNPDEFWCGNMSYGVVRKLFPCIDRVSGDSELDVWEFKPGFEAWTRETVKQLRAGQLSANAVEDLLKAKTDAIKASEKAAKEAGMTPEQVKAARALEKAKTREKKLSATRDRALTLAQDAMKDLGMSPADFRDLLTDCQAIPADPRINAATIKGIAAILIPGDAKLLVQELASLAMINKDRRAADCIAALNDAIRATMQIATQASNTSNPTIPLRKTGS